MKYLMWVIEAPNGPFRQTDCETKPLLPDQVLVKIAAAGVNPLDVKIREGRAAHAEQPFPASLGVEMAGTVVETGPGVSSLLRGDFVYGLVGGVAGRQGTLAEYIVVDSDLLARKPTSLSFREAAALPLVTITAWEGLIDRARVSLGETVLIHGGAGGVGQVAIQLAKIRGATVFATARPHNAAIVEKHGATLIDYSMATVDQYVAEHTGGKGFDVILDTIGGATLDASFTAVTRYTGRVVSILGWGSHSLAPLSFRGASYSGVFTLMPLLRSEGMRHHGEILQQAAELSDHGKLRPTLSEERFTRTSIEDAFAAVAKGSSGRVVVEFE